MVLVFYCMLFGGVVLLGWVVIIGCWWLMSWCDVLFVLLLVLGLVGDLLLWYCLILWVGLGVVMLLINF